MERPNDWNGGGLARTFGAAVLAASLTASLLGPNALYAQDSGDPTNPLKGSVGIHDPSAVIKDGANYYVFASHHQAKTSKDRVTWANQTKRVLNGINPAWWKECDDAPEIWAAEVAYFNGKFHYYYSVSSWGNVTTSCIGVATGKTLDPNSPDWKWEDAGMVVGGPNGSKDAVGTVNAIDPGIYQENGKVYLTWGSFHAGMRMVEIDPATAKPKGSQVVISKRLGEASYIFKVGDWYYFSCSRGGCCNGMESTYQVVYARSKNMNGPFLTKAGKSMVDNNFDVFLDGDATHPGQGGQSFFWDNDTLFMSYHAYTAPDGASKLNIKPVYKDGQDWLSMDPTKGTVVKRATTSLAPGKAGIHSSFSALPRLEWSPKGMIFKSTGEKDITPLGRQIQASPAQYKPRPN